MITTSQKQFILDTLLPYFQDPRTCAFNGVTCLYLTSDGRKCAVGKHMKEGPWQNINGGYTDLLRRYKKEEFFTQEALEQNLSDDIWVSMQIVHDNIRPLNKSSLSYRIKVLETETGVEFPELREFTKKINIFAL